MSDIAFPLTVRQIGVRIGRIPVTKVEPVLHGGAYPAKAVVGEEFPIQARVFREGHDAVAASAILTSPSGKISRHDLNQIWPAGLDIWQAWVRLDEEGDWRFRIEGWSDPWHTFKHHAEVKLPAEMDVALVCLEGQQLLERTLQELTDESARAFLEQVRSELRPDRSVEDLLMTVTNPDLETTMRSYGPRDLVSPTPNFPIYADRKRALYGSWYEFFPRSQGAYRNDDGSWVSGNFDSSHERLAAAAAMGFDVVYLPPIHPIGTAFKKGKNNTLDAGPDDPGSPWAIGSPAGGHDAIHPDLGDEAAFARFVAKAKEHGLEIALDLALQASPDHPWLAKHPEWFCHRPDGTIAFAENPPKKYQDIYPINFDEDPEGIAHEVLRIVLLWIERGVSIFRVDNPHTKPVAFWAWLLQQVRKNHPEVLFLAEAFTRPEMMQTLGAIGFHQGYTYFTWRNTKQELTQYLTECATETAHQFRPNFFVNTPDINPTFLQSGKPAAFAIRAILAATMSPSWGIYSGFELCEHEPLKVGGEEYLDSEKYEFRPRDFTAEPNMTDLITKLNQIRCNNAALQQLRHVTFHETSSEHVIAFSKTDHENTVLVICSLHPDGSEAIINLNLAALGLQALDRVQLDDLLSDHQYEWGSEGFVRFWNAHPAHIFRVSKAAPQPEAVE